MAKNKKVLAPVRQVAKPKLRNEQRTLEEIRRVRDVVTIKKNQTSEIPVEQPEEVQAETPVTDQQTVIETPVSNEPTVSEIPTVEDPKQAQEEIIQEVKSNISIADDLNELTQEDLDKKNIASTVSDTATAIEERVSNLTDDEFPDNEGATDEEDTPEYRKMMNKIKASALVEFFDVVFMIICLIVSKDFSDDAQKKFTLVKPRKEAIKANVFQVMNFSKKKHSPMGSIVMLVLFSYVPLIAIAYFDRKKKQEREKEAERLRQIEQREHEIKMAQIRLNNQFNNTSKPVSTFASPVNEIITEPKKRGRKPRAKFETIEVNTGARVKLMKNGSYKNLDTGEVYKGGRGRLPKWVTEFKKMG